MRPEPVWLIPEPAPAPQVSGIPSLVARILRQRGVADVEAFLNPRLQDLGDPFALGGVRAAAERLLLAADRGEAVTLFGDYDVDGVSSLALLRLVLCAYGIEPRVFLPHRMDEGYGLSTEGVARCLEETKPALVVAVDCGTTSVAEATGLRARGVDLVILDHHEAAPGPRPACVALVNPKADGSAPHLCSAGVVFKVAHGMLKMRPLPKERLDLRAHLDLVALATVADIVPLVGENRTLVRHGLVELSRTGKPGLRALKRVAGLDGHLTAQDIGFRLGPRLNAAGRLDTARHAFELLAADDPATASDLADLLDAQNRERQQVEQAIVREAMALAAACAQEAAIVLAGDDWHPGVVGIVASRVARHFHRPAFIIGFDRAGLGKGSGRSIPGISLVGALQACREHVVKGGGHDMAAGITIERSRVEAFHRTLVAHIAATVDPGVFQPVLEVDARVGLAELDDALLDAWVRIMPFGQGFPEPLLAACRVEPAVTPRLLKEKHFKFTLRQGRALCDAIWFNAADRAPLPPPPWDVVFSLEANEWNGRRAPQMRVQALRAAAP